MFTNILYLDTGSKLGGGQRSLLLLLKNLDRRKFKPLLAAPVNSALRTEADKLGLKFIPINTKTPLPNRGKRFDKLRFSEVTMNFWDLKTAFFQLILAIKKEKISLIHANTFKAGLLGGIAARITKTPIVLHKRFVLSHGILDKTCEKLMNKVILVSKATRWSFTQGNKREKNVVIYNGVDLEEYYRDLKEQSKKFRNKYGIQMNEILLGTITRISPEKGLDVFIKAASKVADAFPITKFSIVGETYFKKDDSYLHELKELTLKLKMREKVIFTGFQNNIPLVLFSIDIAVLPSIIPEACPRMLLEAMAAGKPVIATKVGGIPEVVLYGETGILVPPNDPRALAEAIIFLLKNKAKAIEMGKAGRKRVERLFTIEKNVEETEKIYDKLLSKSRRN